MKNQSLFWTVLSLSFVMTLMLSRPILAQKSDFDTYCASEEEKKLYDLIMAYRKKKKLPEIPFSKSLSYVAREHCYDLYENKPDLQPGCNAHSWSDKGKWSTCCYTADHKQSQCMWDKPKELTNYTGNGFEIAYGESDPVYDSFIATAENSLEAWKKSKGHNNVIVNNKPWDTMQWKAIGIAVYHGYACVWFGTEDDPDGEVTVCKNSEK